MGKLKEKLLNNLTPEEMDDQFELSAFEYVELVERYKIPQKEDEYVPTDDELEKLEQMVQDYYNSKEFREYVENYTPTDEYVNSLTDEQIDEAIAEHNFDEDELERINDSIQLKYTDSDILYVLDGLVEPQKIDVIKDKLNEVWNTKRGLF
jgi:predicted DNA binding CopG/RHH family protein